MKGVVAAPKTQSGTTGSQRRQPL